MVNHKEILRSKSLGAMQREIVDAADCVYNTVTRTSTRTREHQLSPYLRRKSHRVCFRLSQRALFAKCQTTSKYIGRCKRTLYPAPALDGVL